MQPIHLPALGARYWSALCLASIFGANMGDLFARNLGLGHVAGLPFLAVALAIVIVAERFDRIQHESYYWIADHHRPDRRDQLRGLRRRRSEAAESVGHGGADGLFWPRRCG